MCVSECACACQCVCINVYCMNMCVDENVCVHINMVM